jgi:hypothetical protein
MCTTHLFGYTKISLLPIRSLAYHETPFDPLLQAVPFPDTRMSTQMTVSGRTLWYRQHEQFLSTVQYRQTRKGCRRNVSSSI